MPNVLVVDDSKTTRFVLRRCLSFCGVEPEDMREAADGQIALDAILANPPDLVLCDINMPNMNGMELLQELHDRGITPGLPVVMITSRAGARQTLEAVRLGARKLLRKPFNPQSIFLALEEYLSTEEEDDGYDTFGEPNLVQADQQPDSDPPDLPDLSVAMADTLERFAFVVPEVSDQVPTRQVLFQARIAYTKPVHAELTLSFTRLAATTICENLLGHDPEEDDGARCDAVAEIVNVLAGVLYNTDTDVEFGLPSLSIVAPGEPLGPHSVVFSIDDDGPGEMIAHFSLTKTPIPEAVHG